LEKGAFYHIYNRRLDEFAVVDLRPYRHMAPGASHQALPQIFSMLYFKNF